MIYKTDKSILLLVSSLLFLLCFQHHAAACTRVLIADRDQAVMVGRNMDWHEDMSTNLLVYPRNMSRIGNEPNCQIEENWLSWISKYGSIVATGYEDLTTDGFNEVGFSAHILWLEQSEYEERDQSKPGLSLMLWVQYYLDNFKTVEEAVKFTATRPFQIIPSFHTTTQQWGQLHLVLDDASGDSAIFEYIKGKLHIHHDRKNITVTNEPSYDRQLHNLKKYKAFGGDKSLPGGSRSSDRFVRTTYYAHVLPKPKSIKEQLAGVLGILNNAAYPFTADYKTIWHTVSDLTNRIYYFRSTESHNLIVVRLDAFNLDQHSVMKLDMVNHPEYVGDVSDKFQVIHE